jgi:hypothetical protein
MWEKVTPKKKAISPFKMSKEKIEKKISKDKNSKKKISIEKKNHLEMLKIHQKNYILKNAKKIFTKSEFASIKAQLKKSKNPEKSIQVLYRYMKMANKFDHYFKL